ncbi:TACC domain containing protein [Trichuris trichiura]|uniref:TACC domain containing protein n=1 Tax=Trichuris trichiura TaxID=36087 RepID=A0A077ZJL2_TRITR|nr:TACC domain containing protein [Trichuris trichiura]
MPAFIKYKRKVDKKMDKSPDRLSDCSVMTDDSYRTARFEASDDDSITKTNSCQRLYFTTVLENDATANLCTSEAETFCLEDSIEGKESSNITEEDASLSPQQIAVVKPTFPGMDKCEINDEPNEDFMINNDCCTSALDVLNSTCALELLDKASKSSAGLGHSKLPRQSILFKFDPLFQNVRSSFIAELAELKETQDVCANMEDVALPPSDPEQNHHSTGADSSEEASISETSSDMIKKMKERLKELSAEHDELLDRQERLLQQHNENQLALQEMQRASEEYVATIRELEAIEEKEKARMNDELLEKIRQKDKTIGELRHAESSASELLKQMEKLREASSALKQNEVGLRAVISELTKKIDQSEQRQAKFSTYIDDKISSMQTAKKELMKSKNADLEALKAQCKKYKVLIKSFQEESTQKSNQVNSLLSLCNELSARPSALK